MYRLLLIICGLMTLPGLARAEPLNYDYIYLSAGRIEPEQGEERNAKAFGAFYSFTDHFHAFVGVDDGGSYAGRFGADVDVKTWRVGGGGHFFVTENLIVAPTVAFLRSEAERETAPGMWWRNEDDGYVVQVDARWNFVDRWEAIGGLHRSDLYNETDTELVAGILWHPTDWLALGAIAKDRENSSITELTGRWYF